MKYTIGLHAELSGSKIYKHVFPNAPGAHLTLFLMLSPHLKTRIPSIAKNPTLKKQKSIDRIPIVIVASLFQETISDEASFAMQRPLKKITTTNMTIKIIKLAVLVISVIVPKHTKVCKITSPEQKHTDATIMTLLFS